MTESEQSETAGVLRRAADLIDAVGFWDGDCATSACGECATTAIMTITHGASDSVREAALGALKRELGVEKVADVFRWNDSSSAMVVTSKLRAAAASLEVTA